MHHQIGKDRDPPHPSVELDSPLTEAGERAMTTVEKLDELTVEELGAVSGGFTVDLKEVYTSGFQMSGSGGETPTQSVTITPR